MAPIDKPYTTFYWSAIVSIVPGTVFDLFDVETVEWYHDLNWTWVRGHSRSFKSVLFENFVQFPIRL